MSERQSDYMLAPSPEASRLTENVVAARNAVRAVLWNGSNYPAKVTPHMLGQDITPLVDKVTAAALGAIVPTPEPEWEYTVIAPDRVRCQEEEGGGVQCIHFADTDHIHEVDPTYFRGGKRRIIGRRRAAGPWEPIPEPNEGESR